MDDYSSRQIGTEKAERSVAADANLMEMMFDAQRLMLGEIAFARNEWIDRTVTETHLLSEFLSKLAEAHSVKGLRTMYEECAQHQIDFLRRECDRLSKHGKRVIEVSSRLFDGGPPDG
jgi:hypothetical protein